MVSTYVIDFIYKRIVDRRIALAIFGDGVWTCYMIAIYIASGKTVLLWYFLLFSILFIIWTIVIFLSAFMKTPYKIIINADSIKILSKSNKLIRNFDLCTLHFPLVNLKKEWREEFLNENRKVHLLLMDSRSNKPMVIGKSFVGLGLIPMKEAMNVESWIEHHKEKICIDQSQN